MRAQTQPAEQRSSASSRSLPSFRDSATTFSRRRAFLLCQTRRFRIAPSDPCLIGVRPRPADTAVCHSGGVNAQAPTSHLQPRPSPSAHLARPQRNGSQLSILLGRNRARPRFDTASTALARHAALRELRTHRAIHSRRRLSSSARRFALRCMPPRSRPHRFLDLPRAAMFSRVARFMKCLGHTAVASLKPDV